ncbi:hypothetical protein MAPG_08659 [Magnaporthiopsis poae ATCC 64411]|uniref:Uncharacterized protein n=1 Tax=Magnaporthiopsis poae (strain ATCC 64411 / 73-15) TaxID=644358 RepID=A0A0C4E7X7_MAGP6|nr:hypothetical protein MAPG_08659 [Magnaporthiopsis poae ATCC 64411]
MFTSQHGFHLPYHFLDEVDENAAATAQRSYLCYIWSKSYLRGKEYEGIHGSGIQVRPRKPDPFVTLELSKGPTPVTAADIDATFTRILLVVLYVSVRHDEVTAEIEIIGPSCWAVTTSLLGNLSSLSGEELLTTRASSDGGLNKGNSPRVLGQVAGPVV